LLPVQDDPADRDPDPTIVIEEPGGHPSRLTRSPHLPAALHGARGMALLGLAVGASALVALRPWGGGAPDRPAHTVSPRSPLISRSAATLPTGRSTGHQHPVALPADVHRPTVHHERHRRPKALASPRPEIIRSEQGRETIPYVAPVSSPPVTPTTAATPGPTAQAEPAADQTPPSPPPSSSGGGPGGVGDPQAHPGASRTEADTFGFER
jgi:hypothetical protein